MGKNKFTAILFLSFLSFIFVMGILLPDGNASDSERRSLAQIPKFTAESFLNGSYMKQMEVYLSDQFPARDAFRTIKAQSEITILGKHDSYGYVKTEDGIFELEEELNEKNVTRAAQAFENLAENELSEADCYYAVIPDKNYFFFEYDDDTGKKDRRSQYPCMDYDRLNRILAENLHSAKYLNLYDKLEPEDYYRTDLHWRQEKITDVADFLLDSMEKDATWHVAGNVNQTFELATDRFYGSYAKASAFLTEPDSVYFYSDDTIENMSVYDYEKEEEVPVYAPEKIGTADDYDFFLWGPRALLTIQNPACRNGKKLLIFRDSFAGSIAPFLAGQYEETTLLDLRYVRLSYALTLLEGRTYDDVLFLYSTTMLNHSDSMRLQ